ncbi:MAG: hypothetical protein MJ248_02650 [Bacilli bacterium]|nr:hypothetical protein [Bacilli bacterium]
MKLKSILLLVSSISLLAGCNKVSSNSDTLTPDTNTGEIDTGSQDTNTPSNSGDIDTTDTGTDTGSIDTTPVEENQTYTTPTDFISSNGFKGGNQFDNMSDGAAKLKNALDPEGIIIQSVVTSNITIQEHALVESGESVLDLTIGTAKYAGSLTINTSTELKAIKLSLQAYTKYVSFNNTNNIDNSVFQVNDFDRVSMTPGTATSSAPIEEYSYTFTSPTSQVVIKNFDANQRVFIKSVTFTF